MANIQKRKKTWRYRVSYKMVMWEPGSKQGGFRTKKPWANITQHENELNAASKSTKGIGLSKVYYWRMDERYKIGQYSKGG